MAGAQHYKFGTEHPPKAQDSTENNRFCTKTAILTNIAQIKREDTAPLLNKERPSGALRFWRASPTPKSPDRVKR